MKCRYCQKELATQVDYDMLSEGEGEHLCWSDFAQPCIDAEEALDVARARIVELEESNRIDKASIQMSKSSDEFDLVFMETLLVELAMVGRKHLQMVVDAAHFLEKEFDKSDSDDLTRMITDEQYELIKKLGEIVTENVLGNSFGTVKFWLNSAREFFYNEKVHGVDSKTAFKNVIRTLGFPNVTQERNNE